MEENLNLFYTESLETIARRIETRVGNDSIDRISTLNELTAFQTTSINYLKKIVYNLKNKASRNEALSVKLIKETFETTGYHLLYLINTSLEKGKMPDELKKINHSNTKGN